MADISNLFPVSNRHLHGSRRDTEPQFLLLPDGTEHIISKPQNDTAVFFTDHPMNVGVERQYHVRKNERLGYIVMPFLGSRFDDWFLSGVAKGTIEGAGLTPIVDGEASNLIRRLQMMVYDWTITYKSRFFSPFSNTANFFAQAEDGEGIKKVMSYMTGSILSMNSGYFYSILPLQLPLDEWEDFNAELIPLTDELGFETNEFLLEVDNQSIKSNMGMWSLDNLQCDPTGNRDFPFRIRKRMDKEDIWVLVPKNLGGQILGELGSKQYGLAGFWPCPLYTYFGEMGVMNAMLTEYNFEGFFNSPPQGIAGIAGADHPNQLANIIETHMKQREANDSLYYPGIVWISMKNEKGQVFFVPFKKPSEGFDQQEFVKLKQRRLALAFGVTLAMITLEIGVGAVHQAAIADVISEVTGVAYIKNKLQHLLNHKLAPRSVVVMVNIPSSGKTRQLVENLNKAASAVKTLQDAGADLSPRRLIQTVEKFIGETIPEDLGERIGDDDQSGRDIVDQEATELSLVPIFQVPHMIRKGQKVRTIMGAIGEIHSLDEEGVRVIFPWDKHITPPSSHPYGMDELFVEVDLNE